MFKTGDNVLYGADGVCKISEITERTFGDTKIEYYILKPVFNERSTFFVPTGNPDSVAKMHRILSSEEIKTLIESSDCFENWIDSDSERKDVFKNIIFGGDFGKIISLAKTILKHKEVSETNGKKLHKSDEQVLREAEKILYEEMAMVLEITKEDVISVINGDNALVLQN